MSDVSVVSDTISKLSNKMCEGAPRSSPGSPVAHRRRGRVPFRNCDIMKKSTSESNVNIVEEPQEGVEQAPPVKRNSKSEDCLLDIDKPPNTKVQLSQQTNGLVNINKNPVDDIFTRALKERLGLKTEVANPGRVMVLNEDSGVVPMAEGGPGDGSGLIAPKRLVNPCVDSMPRQDLHRELMFNQKIGKSVLNQKTELQKALSKHKEKKIITQEKDNKETPELERAIQERARRLEEAMNNKNESEKIEASCNLQYIEARARLRHAK